MSAVVIDKVVRSTTMNLDIPACDLGTFLRRAWEKFKDRTAMVDDSTGVRYTYREVQEMSSRVAVGLKKLGFQPGDMAGVHSIVHVDLVFAFYGTVFAGGSTVFAKSNLTQREVEYQFSDSCPVLVFCDEANAEKTRAACETIPSVKTLVVLGKHDGMVSFDTLKKSPLGEFKPPPYVDPESHLANLYSSGTTGLPKGVMMTHRNFVAILVCTGDAGVRLLEEDDVMLGSAPFTHVSGLWLCSTAFSVGAKVIIMAKNDVDSILRATETHKATVMLQFPTGVQKLVQSPLVERYDISSMKKLIVGGSTTPLCIAQAVIEKFKLKCFRHAYGMSETCGGICITPASIRGFDSVGSPIPMTQMKVLDIDTRKKLGPRQQGEICIKGPFCIKAYYNKPEATAKLFDEEGFIKTGDIGYYTEEGIFYIVDRYKELIKCMDQQVAPAELEDLLLTHEAVKEAVVVGVPHPEYGEAARAFIVLFQGHIPDIKLATELENLVAGQFAYHKHLHGGIEFLNTIPKSDTGKNLRRVLRDSFIKNQGPRGT